MSQNGTIRGSRLERKKEETKQKIIAVAMKLFMEQDLDSVTMEQIAEEVDIAKGTLYNYFPVKEAILDEYIKRAFKERNPGRLQRLRSEPDTRSRMILLLNELMEGVQARPEIFERYHVYRVKKMISLQQDASVESGLSTPETEIIRLGQASGEIRTDIPLDLLIDLFDFAFIEVAMQFYKEPEKFDASLAIDRCVDLFLNGAKQVKVTEDRELKKGK
jgi:AcrR family transcriptional regulator